MVIVIHDCFSLFEKYILKSFLELYSSKFLCFSGIDLHIACQALAKNMFSRPIVNSVAFEAGLSLLFTLGTSVLTDSTLITNNERK